MEQPVQPPRLGRRGAGEGGRRDVVPDPELARAAQRLVLHFVLLVLASLVTATLPLPLQVAALVFAVAAVVVGLRALRLVWRPGLRAQLAPLLLFGLAFAGLLTVSLSVMLALWPVQMERQTCMSRALTLGAQEACQARYEESLVLRLEELMGGPTD